MALVVVAVLTSCTSGFDNYNDNPNEASEEMMSRDGLSTGAFLQQMERNVFIVGKDKGGEYQITEMLAGDLYAGYVSNIGVYSYASYHNAHYQLYSGWYNAAFNDAYTDIMQPWLNLKQNAEKDDTPAVAALATVIKVYGMLRITDMYGPIPYTQFGSILNVPYDAQQDVYNAFFDELGDAIATLTDYYNASSSASILPMFDYVYGGKTVNWIKFANTLRLRLAVRIAYADEGKARQEAAEAINHPVGLLSTADEAAKLNQTLGLSFLNPLWEVSNSFNDSRMCASIESYLKGYNDPRMAAYFLVANDGAYHGVYPGLSMTESKKATCTTKASGLNFSSSDPMWWMTASESYFLQAEAKLRWNLGTSTVKNLYETGIKTSFAERGVSGADAYVANATAKPANFIDNVGSNNANAVGSVTIAWDDNASTETKLERIITQKWLAIYPDGQEAWSEYRRTGYPHLFTVAENRSGGTVDTNLQIRRLRFPVTEYDRNTANVNAAVGLLGGPDNGGTRLWWDKK